MKNALEAVGFQVEKVEIEYRPNGGLEDWIRLMGAQFLGILPAEK